MKVLKFNLTLWNTFYDFWNITCILWNTREKGNFDPRLGNPFNFHFSCGVNVTCVCYTCVFYRWYSKSYIVSIMRQKNVFSKASELVNLNCQSNQNALKALQKISVIVIVVQCSLLWVSRQKISFEIGAFTEGGKLREFTREVSPKVILP